MSLLCVYLRLSFGKLRTGLCTQLFPIMNQSLASEFQIERSGLCFARGSLHYAWFQLAEQNGERRVRAVAFKELTYLPIETRDDPDLLGKQ